MVWYKNLYVGRLIARKKKKVIDDIDHGRYPANAYVIILPESENSQLEMMSALELRHDYIRDHCLMIVGIARGKTEATSLLERLVKDVYADRKDADIRAWLLERRG